MNKVLFCVVLGLFAITATSKMVSGTAGNDNLFGTTAVDEIYGLAGDDTINALNGNDLVWGGEGDDTIDGKGGDDVMYGDSGDDTTVFGDDTINGGDGNDRLYGDEGDDTLRGDAGDDRLEGGEGNDDLNAGSGNDVVYGGAGNDIITQDGGAGTIYPGDGDDQVFMNDADPGTEIILGEGLNTVNFGPRFGGDVVIQKFSHNDVIYFSDCDALYDPVEFTTIRTKQGGSVKINGNGVANKQIFMDRCSCGTGSDCIFDGTNPTATTGIATTGVVTTGVVTTGVQTTGVQTTGVQTTGVVTTGVQTTGLTGATTTGNGVITPTVCAATAAYSNSIEAAPLLCTQEADAFTDTVSEPNAVTQGITRFFVQTAGVTRSNGRLQLAIRLVNSADAPCPTGNAYKVNVGNTPATDLSVSACAPADVVSSLKVYFRAQTGDQYTVTLTPRGTNANPNLNYGFDSNVEADWNAFISENSVTPAVAFNARTSFLLTLFGRDNGEYPGPAGSAQYLSDTGCTCPIDLTGANNINGVMSVVSEADVGGNGECHSFYVWRLVAQSDLLNQYVSSKPFEPCCGGCPVLP